MGRYQNQNDWKKIEIFFFAGFRKIKQKHKHKTNKHKTKKQTNTDG